MSRSDGRPTRTSVLSKSLEERRRSYEEESRTIPTFSRMWRGLTEPSLGLGLLVSMLFAVGCTALALWTRGQGLVAVDRVMKETRLVRAERLETVDPGATKLQREAARQRTPRVYAIDRAAFDELMSSIEQLPRALAAVKTLPDVSAPMQLQFALTPTLLESVRSVAGSEDGLKAWDEASRALRAQLEKRPLLDAKTYQAASEEGLHRTVRLTDNGVMLGSVHRGEVVNLEDLATVEAASSAMAREAGFVGPLRVVVVNRIRRCARPTYTFDASATALDQAASEAEVQPVTAVNTRGQVIFQRGEVLTQAQRDLYAADLRATDEARSPWERWAQRASVLLACGAVALGLSGYSVLFVPKIRRRSARVIGAAALLLTALCAACFGAAIAPQFLGVVGVLPTVLVTMLLCIGYDRRTALAFGLLHGLLVCICLREGVPMLAVITTGVACVVSTLKEVKNRRSLVRVSVLAGLGLGAATLVFGLLERPVTTDSLRELGLDAALLAGGVMLLGGLTLLTLPWIERAFNVTTGMTLSEMRDPKQPLLRELQMRAPGTYTHSLNVASICEGAAEAIGADSLLAYVGALYHDVGKMNKPEYFVENQQGGPNKHDRLTPAMSLLIVVGHVKDGMELAREFRLPVRIQHFIESHHGTTLVEYFYHRARQQAFAQAAEDHGEAAEVDEFSYRYPGPLPRTKEAAILMIADACESASRALGEPTPGRIEELVREVADKRLRDGQFDDCELTLREVSMIVESVTRTLTSMYHARIAYPNGGRARAEQGVEAGAGAGDDATRGPRDAVVTVPQPVLRGPGVRAG